MSVSGHHRCVECVAVTDDVINADGMPPSASVTLSQSNAEFSEVIQRL